MRKLIGSLAVVCLGASLLGCSMDVGEVGETGLALKPGAHFVGDPDCVQLGTSLNCSGTVAGLGNQAAVVELEVERICINNGRQRPPGLVTGTTGPIEPERGRIDFDVTVSAGCPSHNMTLEYVSPATISIFQDGELVFVGDIDF